MSWTEEWLVSVGQRVSAIIDPCEYVEGVVVKVYPLTPCMKIKGDDGRVHFTHPRYVRKAR